MISSVDYGFDLPNYGKGFVFYPCIGHFHITKAILTYLLTLLVPKGLLSSVLSLFYRALGNEKDLIFI